MLGIRRFRGVAIDLWQGPLKDFKCDGLYLAASCQRGQASAPVGAASYERWLEGLRTAESLALCLQEAKEKGCRHVSFYIFLPTEEAEPPSLEAHARLAMEALYLALSQAKLEGSPVRRLSFLALQTKGYESLQKALFKTFPEIENKP